MINERNIIHELHSVIFALNAIVKEHLTDGSGKTTANFKSIDKTLKELSKTLELEKQREQDIQDSFERRVMGDQFEDK